ncbi:IS1096 element passenger TnpR family protein [Brevibacterium samyangense]|uniref:Plasmid pRiA4b Orf3-like domain-containing protein n=1 Tax=Brevibacterium samyangense TaxID=366888 RepID=A0ABN2TA68_9MICO
MRPIPSTVRGFRIRIDLHDTEPLVWRRFDIAGDVTLAHLHDVVQIVMGWTDSHLHRFRTGSERFAPEFLTRFDVEVEGDEGILEDDVRLDQVVTREGDRLWYDYDFGDDWDHVLRVEEVLPEPPAHPACLAGRRACPPEDCGGTRGYGEIAAWVRSDHDPALLPENHETAENLLAWLPPGWHPDVFDLDGVNALLTASASLTALTGSTGTAPALDTELAAILADSRDSGPGSLLALLTSPSFSAPSTTQHTTTRSLEPTTPVPDPITPATTLRMTEPYRILIDTIGDGWDLTSAGRLKPALVRQIARHTGISDWWIGRLNREDHTLPVAHLRESARALGLLTVRKGRITVSRAGRRATADPQLLLAHIMKRLPLGRGEGDRTAGWVTLAAVGAEVPPQDWRATGAATLRRLGWEYEGGLHPDYVPATPTQDVIEFLAGEARHGKRPHGFDPEFVSAVAAAARRRIRSNEAPAS